MFRKYQYNLFKLKKTQKIEINKIVLFYNNLRGDELRKKLEKNFQIYSIVTKKNLNYDILKKKNKDLKVISSLNNKFLFKYLNCLYHIKSLSST